MKSRMSLLAAVVVMVGILGCGGGSNSDLSGFVRAPESDFEVRPGDDKKSVTITRYSGPGGINIIIPATIQGLPVSAIGDKAFYESLITGAIIPEGVTEIGYKAFAESNITNITISNSVKFVGTEAFEHCKALTTVIIGNGVTQIGRGAFNFATALESVTIPNSVTHIGRNAFLGCESITSITIGSSVTTIEGQAFSSGNALAIVISLNPTPPDLRGHNHFSGLRDYGFSPTPPCLYVPASSIDAYRAANGWKHFACIRDLDAAPTFSSGGGKEGVDSRQLQKQGDVYVLATNQKPYSGRFVNSNSDIMRDITRDLLGDDERININDFPKNFFTAHTLSGSMKDGKLHGEVTLVKLKGVKFVISYRDGIIHGQFKDYHENGQLATVGNYNNGKKDGKFENFHQNGQLKSIVNYTDGKQQDGKFESYHENGQLWITVNYKDGKRDGKFESYHENGQLRFTVNYNNGKPDNVTKVYNESGQLDAQAVRTINSILQQQRQNP